MAQGDTHLVRILSYRNLKILPSVDLKNCWNMLKVDKIKQLRLMGMFFSFLFISIRQVHD